MLYLTCTTITSVDLAHYGVSRAKHWVSVDCGTSYVIIIYQGNSRHLKKTLMCLNCKLSNSFCFDQSNLPVTFTTTSVLLH